MEFSEFFSKKPFTVVAHRGASGYEPENTIKAIEKAIDMNADAVEVDVRLSKDGVPVVIHDETLNRTTNGSGRVDSYTSEQLKNFDAGKGEKIPLLSEVLDMAHGRICLLLELKEIRVSKRALRVVESKGMLNQVMFTSFYEDALKAVAEANTSTYRGLIYAKPGNFILIAKSIGCLAVMPHYRLASLKTVEFAHRLKLKVNVWTVDDLETARELAERGVDSITTNKPGLIVSLRKTL
ncbi:glycerophosphodiester phosphodiesterase [Candidatus Bathyarchaeota archaeon]|nr:glycerophosphodiester phosphodiesterase [Candidatus Bathyarchaeota archaeon]